MTTISFQDRTTPTRRARQATKIDLITEFAQRFDEAVLTADRAAMVTLAEWAEAVGLHQLAARARWKKGEM